MYVNKIEGKQITKMSGSRCELIALSIPSINTVNIVSYGPPNTN